MSCCTRYHVDLVPTRRLWYTFQCMSCFASLRAGDDPLDTACSSPEDVSQFFCIEVIRTGAFSILSSRSSSTMAAQPSLSLFEAVTNKDYDTIADLYADNARRTIVSFLAMRNRWSPFVGLEKSGTCVR